MIYIIEINYTDPQSEADWNAWYEGYLREMVTVPGILTAQRFLGENAAARKHLAVYTLAGLSVYAEPRYKEVGGGGFASAKWKANIKRRRNLYDGVELVPEVRDGSRLLMTETEPVALDLADVLFVPVEVTDMRAAQADPGSSVFGQVPFDNDPGRRHLAIVPADRASDVAERGTIAVYRPSSPRLIGRRRLTG
jgi:hypothetical protein